MLPHVGLVLLCAIYTIVGAAIFLMIEAPHEQRTKDQYMKEIKEIRFEILEELWNLTQESRQPISALEWKSNAVDRINNLTAKLFEAFDSRVIDINDIREINGSQNRWTYPAAMFFATTTIATIGKKFCLNFPNLVKGFF